MDESLRLLLSSRIHDHQLAFDNRFILLFELQMISDNLVAMNCQPLSGSRDMGARNMNPLQFFPAAYGKQSHLLGMLGKANTGRIVKKIRALPAFN